MNETQVQALRDLLEIVEGYDLLMTLDECFEADGSRAGVIADQYIAKEAVTVLREFVGTAR